MIFADSTHYTSRGKELYEETGFWNGADTAVNKHVDVGVQH
jgi:hypothetical protein